MLNSYDFRGLINQRFVQNLLPIPPINSLDNGKRTPDFELPDITNGKLVRLSDYWGVKPVILALTRIFTEKQYCPFCFPHILALNNNYEKFLERGIEILMITSTDREQSKTVVSDLSLKMPLLSDSSCQVFKNYQVGQALGAPLPGQFVLDKQGRLSYKHLFSFLDHNASIEDLLEVLDNYIVEQNNY
ncbi:MAG: redoxin domain-containing protein [Okeania sp. SIO2G4]|uniref:peroxiredoxin family protein n=1 Tax=unclassified Okeania TaxID=2634635 RepID=UPI0013BA26EB|nr:MULTISPECIES: redoxin domain-containing protein [unclassified Okeania]NEP05732.1 redoxin domain-containing protein [Okeania sp. SIO4D6]NEP41435.1 redoxin domain-containing protein [Okeania sp. SIO2H7]NEP71255.1 redoxin domain-containing protein [Okeania sp. SIO2G5]NEP92169.1 redoxin domain-containing protein [Okeania sp. SIO2F5]NEQ90198.1 redoxin domain-containing protein [Okeania sp. SIO2G4]